MCCPHDRRRRLVLVLAALLVLVPAPGAPAREPGDASAEVARLYEEAARAIRTYERGSRAAAAQHTLAVRLQGELTVRRRELAALYEQVGEVARAQYRTGGSLDLAARVLLAEDPDQVMRAQRLAGQANRAVNRLMVRARGAERRMTRAQARAHAAWRDLEARRARLAGIRRDIERRLERVRWKLRAEADRSVADGRCRTPVPLVRPGAPGGPARGRAAWVAPVAASEEYALSAGFAQSGAHWAKRHTGQDLAVEIGTPVRSIGAGRVRSVSCGGAFGIEVVVGHQGGWYSQYAHLSAAGVRAGDRVLAGQWIGQSGTTGNSTGPHLHFEVRLTLYQGSAVDPLRWLRERGVRLPGGP
ncbi:M23 family metallopeptidase [Streptomyces sp. NPDC050856]|uniref:M23 family metallopeptidase n=1 Tax=Streptomyces sp. NPDC050856 TaxID=3154939 RepID=UPI0033F955CF